MVQSIHWKAAHVEQDVTAPRDGSAAFLQLGQSVYGVFAQHKGSKVNGDNVGALLGLTVGDVGLVVGASVGEDGDDVGA